MPLTFPAAVGIPAGHRARRPPRTSASDRRPLTPTVNAVQPCGGRDLQQQLASASNWRQAARIDQRAALAR